MNNYIIRESAQGFSAVDIEAALLTERKIFFTEEVNQKSCNILIQQLLFFYSEDPGREITIYLNCPGGSVTDGLAVYDVMKMVDKTAAIKTICIGTAASMGAIFFLAPRKENRLMLKHSNIMIHDPSYSGGSFAHKKPHQLRQEVNSLEECGNILRNIIAESSGHPIEEITELMMEDKYFTAEEAVKFGLAGGIADKL